MTRMSTLCLFAAAMMPAAAYAMDIKVAPVHIAAPHITTTPHLSTPQFKSATSHGSGTSITPPQQGAFKNGPGNASPAGTNSGSPSAYSGSSNTPQGRDNGSSTPPQQGAFKNGPGNGSSSPP